MGGSPHVSSRDGLRSPEMREVLLRPFLRVLAHPNGQADFDRADQTPAVSKLCCTSFRFSIHEASLLFFIVFRESKLSKFAMGADNLSLASTRSRSSSRARGGGSRASSIASATSSRRKKVTWADHPELTKGVDENRFIGALEGPELDHIKGTRHFLVEDGEDKKWPFLLRFKNVIFGVSLGLAAQAVMWKYLTHIDVMKPYKIPAFVNETFWIVALLALLISFFIYSLKIIFWRGGVYREFLHPVRVNFFFAPFVVSLLLMLAIPQRFIIIPSNFNQVSIILYK